MSRFSGRALVGRSLAYYWRSNVAVVLGVAVAVAVLVGSLLVGDSVRGSLRDLALQRLGRTDHALLTPTFFREELAGDLLASPPGPLSLELAVPAIILDASARHASSGVSIPSVTVLAVDDAFWQLGRASPPARLQGRSILINQNLAEDLAAAEGDAILISIGQRGAAPVESLFGRRGRTDTVRSLRTTVAAVVPTDNLGRFTVELDRPRPRNVYVSLSWLQGQLGRQGRANALLLAVGGDGRGVSANEQALRDLLASEVRLEDYGLRLVPNEAGGSVSLQSNELVLPGAAVLAARQAARQQDLLAEVTSIYLANSLALVGRGEKGPSVPYSVVAGLDPRADPPLGPLTIADGGEPPELGPEDILLNAWAAEDLGAGPGDRVEMTYYVAGERGELSTGTRTFTLRGVVAMSGPALDPDLVPDLKGITDSDSVADWDPPFPIDLDLIRPKDDDYWKQYRTAPKAFVSLSAARSLWLSAHGVGAGGSDDAFAGWVTSVRMASSKAGEDLPTRVEEALLAQLSPETFGLSLRPVKEQALASAEGSTDFGVLFLSMSMFLVASAAGLVALLLRLTAERRASQYGVLLATGFTSRDAARVLMSEGLLLAGAGVVLGAPLGVGYAWLIVFALGTYWQGAVGEFAFALHVTAFSLVVGSLGGLAAAGAAVWWGTRVLRRTRAVMLLAGWRAMSARPAGSVRRRALVVGVVALSAAAFLLLLAGVFGVLSPTAAFFGGGSALLIGALALVCACFVRREASVSRPAGLSLPRLAVRGASRNWLRSALTVGLVACASFLIVAVAANRRDLSRLDTSRPDSGAGGFALLARSALPIYVDLNSEVGRKKLGFQPRATEALMGTHVVPFRLSSGEDVSCLNLQRPQTPRVLGVPAELVERDGFVISEALPVNGGEAYTSNPWELLNATLTSPPPPAEEEAAFDKVNCSGRPERPSTRSIAQAALSGVEGRSRRAGAGEQVIPAFADGASARWILHLGLGDEVEVPGADGRPVRLRLVGLLADSVFAGELLVSEDRFKEHLRRESGYRFFLIETPAGREEAVMTTLREELGGLGFDVGRTADVLAGYARVQNTYLATFQALGGLGLLLGTFGMVTVLLRGVLERRSELAMMLALGFRRGQLVGLVLMENGVLLVLGLAIGTACALVAVAPQLASALTDVKWVSLAGTLLACGSLGLASCVVASSVSVRGELLSALRSE